MDGERGGQCEANRSKQKFAIRAAQKGDLDGVARIHRDGFTEEPQVHYCYPLRDKYPEDYWKWTRKEYKSYLEQPEKFLVLVIEASSESNGNSKLAGLAVWNRAVLIKANDTDLGLEERKDTNTKHCEAFVEAAGERFKTFFAEYAEKQINLSALVVHPDFRRHGAGTMLVNWGIESVKEKEWPVTLCASPMGQLLYEHLKFKKTATEIVQVEDEEETLTSTVMVYRKA